MKYLLALTKIFFLSSFCFGQVKEFEIPKEFIDPETRESYISSKEEALRCIEYLETASLMDSIKRKNSGIFLMNTKVKGLQLEVAVRYEIISTFEKYANVLMINFVGGWIRYQIESYPDALDDVQANTSGLRSVIAAYESNTKYLKDSKIDKLVKLDKRGKLEAWVRDQID